MLYSLVNLDIQNINCYIVRNEHPTLDTIKPMNLFNNPKNIKENNMKNEDVPKSIFDELNKTDTFPTNRYLKPENPFSTFDPFNINEQNNPLGHARIIITRFSKPDFDRKFEDDSLYEDSELSHDYSNNRHIVKPKKHRNRRQRSHKHRNSKPAEPERLGFMQRVSNFFTSISFSRIFFAFVFSSFFMLIGYSLRKNEEESNYVRLAPQ